MPPKQPGKVDWVAVGTLIWSVLVPVISAITVATFYLIGRFDQIDSTLHTFDLRFMRVEARMGIDEAPQKVAGK